MAIESKGIISSVVKCLKIGEKESSGGGAPISCAITLLDNLSGFGYTSFNISGQTLGITAAGSTNYANATALSGEPVSWSGIRVIEGFMSSFDSADTGQSPVPVQFARASDFDNAFARWEESTGNWVFGHANGAGSNYGSVDIAGSATDEVQLGIDGTTGDVTGYINGTLVMDKNTTPTDGVLTGLGALFSSASAVIISQLLSATASTVYEVEIRTASGDIVSPPSGVNDWCGNAI